MNKPTLPEVVARRIRRDGPLMLIDLGIVGTVYLAALVIRFDGAVPSAFWSTFWPFLPVVMALHLATNHLFGLYGRMWRYASINEARRVAGAGIVAGLAALLIATIAGDPRQRLLPLSVIILGATFAFLGFGALRFQSRLFALRRRAFEGELHNVLVVGAGEAGAMLLRDLSRHPHLGINPVALVDDDRRKMGRSIHGVRVLGDRHAIPSLIARLDVDQVLLAIPSATSDLVSDVASLCEQENITLKVLPSVREIVGRVTARDIRDVRIEDLLGRQQVEIDLESVKVMLAGKRVLVTGAGGSIGSEIAKQVSSFEPASLVLLDHDETHLHDIAVALPEAHIILADIRGPDRMEDLLERHRPEVVFHAAAHKHVPMLESHPEEALHTNVIGTANVARAAVASAAERFILISTDKAVRPVSIMGASKRLAENAIWTMPLDGCTFCAVRFGNVLGSRGSVIPTFFAQIARGGPVTVTDPDMTRYFMSVQESVQLVLQAAALAQGGEVFTLDMGSPVNILDLAHKVIRLSGRRPEQEIEIEIIGPRPGEKLEEDVSDPSEHPLPSKHPSVVVSRPRPESIDAFGRSIDELVALAAGGRTEDLARRMRALGSGIKAASDQEAQGPSTAPGAAWGRSTT